MSGGLEEGPMKLFQGLVISLIIGALLGSVVLFVASYLHLPVPEPHQKPIFLIGVVLFTVAFRLLMVIRGDEDLSG